MAFPHRTAPSTHLAQVTELPQRGAGPAAGAGGRTVADGDDVRRWAPRRRTDDRRGVSPPADRRPGGSPGGPGPHPHRARAVPDPRPRAVRGPQRRRPVASSSATPTRSSRRSGLEFRGDADALRLLRDAGADVQGERVRFPRGLCRSIVQATAPRQFTQVARNPDNNVEIGGRHTVLAPNYGSPFVRDLDGGRRYGTIEDFRNFVKLAYLSPHLHHCGGTVCEPVDVPVNKRHLDMVYSHIRTATSRSWAR